MYDRLVKFFKEDLWLHSPGGSFIRSFFLSFLRILISSIRGFSRDDCFLKSSALTYYSLLSIVPVLAVAFGIAKGFGFDNRLQQEILIQLHEQPEVAHKIIDFSYSLLEHTQGGIIAGIGAIGLFYTVLKLLENIELSLNSIWHVSSQRPWTRKFSDYLATMIFCPFFFVISSSMTIYFTTLVTRATKEIQILDYISPLIFLSLNIIPYVFSCLLFTFIYLFMPNTKVPWKSGLIAGIVAGTAYQVLQIVYIKFQIALSNYGTIYGSFAALPLFLVWMNLSWIIVLAGAEVAYHLHKDRSNRLLAEFSKNYTLTSSRLVGLQLVWHCVNAFRSGKPPVLLEDLAKVLGISPPQMQEIAIELVNKKVLSEVIINSEEEEVGYQPAHEASELTIKEVCEALDPSVQMKIPIYPNAEIVQFQKTLAHFDTEIAHIPSNIPIISIKLPSTSDNSKSPE